MIFMVGHGTGMQMICIVINQPSEKHFFDSNFQDFTWRSSCSYTLREELCFLPSFQLLLLYVYILAHFYKKKKSKVSIVENTKVSFFRAV